jgi:hypothetical protein
VKRGAWHQFGDRSQKLALEQLQHGAGVGVIISPRDLSFPRAEEYAAQYQAAGAEILIDQQFHIPHSTVGQLDTYPIAAKRDAVSQLKQVSDTVLAELAADLHTINKGVRASAVLAPAVVYEAGRPDIVELNAKLYAAAKSVAESIGIPCYATVFLGQSATTADSTTESAIAAATALPADGWYFAFEFDGGRIPSSAARVSRYLRAGLALAATGLPVLHGYVGPLAPLAFACGASGAGVGHSQNVWQFTRARWEPTEPGGGGGDAPPRYFSRALWGTIIYEDEFALLSQELREKVLSPTPFSANIRATQPYLPWERWEANKHLVHVICKMVEEVAAKNDAELALDALDQHLSDAISIHATIAALGVALGDETATYQAPWCAALNSLKANHTDDFEFLRLLS